MVHYGFIEAFIEELGTKFNIREIAFERWGAVQMTQIKPDKEKGTERIDGAVALIMALDLRFAVVAIWLRVSMTNVGC